MRISYCQTLIMTGEALWMRSSFRKKACQRGLDFSGRAFGGLDFDEVRAVCAFGHLDFEHTEISVLPHLRLEGHGRRAMHFRSTLNHVELLLHAAPSDLATVAHADEQATAIAVGERAQWFWRFCGGRRRAA